MAATTTAKTTWLIKQLENNFNEQLVAVSFKKSDYFSWDHAANTIYYNPSDPNVEQLLLHEASHALLAHKEYSRDIELLAMERDAWQQAVRTGLQFGITVQNDTVEDALDTYRDWLHARSTCPYCSATGVQTACFTYSCIACSKQWRVNEARMCSLRRYKQK